MTDQVTAACSLVLFHNQDLTVTDSATQQPSPKIMFSQSKLVNSTAEDTDGFISENRLSNGTYEVENTVALGDDTNAKKDLLAVSNDGMSEFSNSDLSLPEVCISTHTSSFEEDMNYEVQQAYRIFTGFLLDKHKGITSSFLHPIGHQEAQRGIGGVLGWGQAQLKQSMCLQRMEEKFINQEYESISEFVADFRLMLENCYRYHGVDHWISKQAQKLEIMLEQKLTLLSRPLREKTALVVTSKGRFGAEEERGSGGTSTRRRVAPRSLATITVGGHESIMVQTLRVEEQQRAREEKRQRELEKKEAEEMSAKEVEEWEQNLLSQASPQTVDTLWELPAIGHFLCLAQTALNLPEIVFFELERCLLMPRCSLLLSKIMSSLLSPTQRRATLHRRPALPYRRWESELRQRVMGWYRTVGASHDQPGRAEQLGLCHQFFSILGEVSPLEEKPFHLLPFYQRVWLLKGLCDHVYETQKDVQDAVLAQPIHECRESILGYDSKENAYIHFPHFCGADLRIYCQSPSPPPAFPFPSVWVKRVEMEPGTEGEDTDGKKDAENKNDIVYYGGPMDTHEFGFDRGTTEIPGVLKRENGDGEVENKNVKSWSLKKERSDSGSSDGDSHEGSKWDLKIHTNSLSPSHTTPVGSSGVKRNVKEDTVELEHHSKRLKLKQEQCILLDSVRIIKAETQEPCLNVGEHCYTGRSPARSVNLASPTKLVGLKIEESPGQGHQRCSCLECCKSKCSNVTSEEHNFSTSRLAAQLQSLESAQNSSEERATDRIWTKKKKRKKKRGREPLLRLKGQHKQMQRVDGMRLPPAEASKSAEWRVAMSIKKKDKKKKQKTGKKLESLKKIKAEPAVEPSFKLVCTSLEELRELISKTEDELDDLESTKKRLGRWYYRREAVKDLHSTLIRLLNELSPWEPKLVKAYQRNRLRLKKEFDDYTKHPEYSNFVREECISSSSSSDDDDEEEKKILLSDHYRRSEEEDLEHMVPRGLWSGASTKEFVAESSGEKIVSFVSPNHLKHPLATDKGASLLPRVQTNSSNITSSADSGSYCGSEKSTSNQFRDSKLALTTGMPAQTSVPTTGLPKGYTPIPTLLAKSVGNKVTLMKRPADRPGVNHVEAQKKKCLITLPSSALATTKISTAQSSSPSSGQNPQQMQSQGLQPTQVLSGHSGIATVMKAPPKSPQNKSAQTVAKKPVQMVVKVAEGLGHQLRKDSSSQVKISVHPVTDQNTTDKILQQVAILPSKLLIHAAEEKASFLHQEPMKTIQVPVSKVSSPVCMSTNVPGFTIPENRIPVQQVAPLKDARTSSLDSPSQQHGALNTAALKQVCTPQVSTQSVMPNPFPITSHNSSLSSSITAESVKSKDPKQELKTVCIRDSRSILVTTRGGNTGIVKVQTSSDSALGSLPTSPVITISPQFKAFLIAKTSPTLSPGSPTQTSPCTNPTATNISLVQPHKQVPSVIKSPTVTTSMFTAVTCGIPVTGQESHTARSTVALSLGSNTSVGSTAATNIGQLAQVHAAGSQFQASLVNNTVVVPSLSSSGVPQNLTQAEVTGVKWAGTDERSQVTKIILVTPSPCSTSNVALSEGTHSSTKSLTSSRLMFISQPTATSSTTFVGSIPKQTKASGASGPLVTTLKTGLSSVSGSNSETMSMVKNISLASGLHGQLSAKTTTDGKNIGALTSSSSKSTPVSVSNPGQTPVTITTVTSSNTITSYPAHPVSHVTTSFQLQSIPTFTMIAKTGSSTCTSTLPAGNVTRKDLGTPANISSSTTTAWVTTAMQSSPNYNSMPALVHQPSDIQSNEETASFSCLFQRCLKKPQMPIPSATSTTTPLTTSVTSTAQQRIVINTTTPLAAGTQILLNNARFVVPPQGLGPGTHVLIISSPAPQQVPTASAASTRALVPPPVASDVTVAHRAPVLSQSPARLPSGVAASSPFITCTAAVGSALLATSPSVMPVHLTGTPGLGSALLPSKTNVVPALPRTPATELDNVGSGSLKLVSSPPRLGSVPALLSPSAPSAPMLSSVATVGRPMRAQYPSTILPAVTHCSPRLSAQPSSLPILPSPSAVALSSPVSLSSAATPRAAGTPVNSSLAAHRVVSATTPGPGTYLQQTAVRIVAPSTTLSQALLHTGLDNASIKTQVPAPVVAATRTQVLPTVAVPPIVTTVSKVQTLPIATVLPIGSTVRTFEMSPVVTTPPSNRTGTMTPAQPMTSLRTDNTIHPPDILTSQAVGKGTLQTSALGVCANVASKLLISPDGAVLSTVPCRVNPAELTAGPKPLDALMVSHNSSNRTLYRQDSSLQPSQANTK